MQGSLKFFLFLLERYAWAKNRPTGEVLLEWDARGVTREIYDNYEQYHQERIENAVADIDSLVACGEHAW